VEQSEEPPPSSMETPLSNHISKEIVLLRKKRKNLQKMTFRWPRLFSTMRLYPTGDSRALRKKVVRPNPKPIANTRTLSRVSTTQVYINNY